jgi:hypothetical protein
MNRRAALAAVCLGLCLEAPRLTAFTGAEQASAAAEAWHPFEGTWSVTGRRQTLATEAGGKAAIVEASGAIVLRNGEGLSRGFRGEVIAFDDGQGMSVGRSVWTDERGDRVFSRMKGDGFEAAKHVTGTITGGTGRYAGLEGEYSLTWSYIVVAEDGSIQGRAIGLTGRVRRRGPSQ